MPRLNVLEFNEKDFQTTLAKNLSYFKRKKITIEFTKKPKEYNTFTFIWNLLTNADHAILCLLESLCGNCVRQYIKLQHSHLIVCLRPLSLVFRHLTSIEFHSSVGPAVNCCVPFIPAHKTTAVNWNLYVIT